MASPYIILTVLMLALASTPSFAEIVVAAKSQYYILEPHKLELVCNFKNASTIHWEKDSKKIELGTIQGISVFTAKDKSRSTLTKTNTSIADAGKYKCVGDNQHSQTFTVDVFKVITHDITIVSKEPAQIKCDLQNIDKKQVTEFYWMKNHTEISKIPEIKNRYTEDLENYTLSIAKAKRKDNGVYNCVFKIDGQDFSINVNMNMAPWIESMEKSRNLVQGDKLHLECNVVSHPTATIMWMKDNVTFSKDVVNRVFMNKNRTLIIYDLQFSDKGDYTCVATNSVNSTSMTVLVRVKDKLAALWPFLGIVAEVVILCIIIFICEKRRSKEMEDEYENAGPQSMPNAKDHKGKDEIRQRNVRT